MSNKLEVSKMSYDEKRQLYNELLSLGTFGSDMNDKLILVSLLSLTYQKMQEKDSNITPLKILLSITKQKVDDSIFYNMLESLSLLVEEFSYGIKSIDSCGLTSSSEILNKIKEILNKWIPF